MWYSVVTIMERVKIKRVFITVPMPVSLASAVRKLASTNDRATVAEIRLAIRRALKHDSRRS
jgi:hypothetical protein